VELFLYTPHTQALGLTEPRNQWVSEALSFTFTLIEVSDQLHAPAALTPGKEPLVPIG
jgi:hypothetical protein